MGIYMEPEKPIKLHLGCGKRYIKGFINIDAYDTDLADLTSDVRNLPMEHDTVDLIYASHVLEHLDTSGMWEAILEWNRVLKKDGVVRISVPNFEAVVDQYRKGVSLLKLKPFIYGGENAEWDRHFFCFDKATLISIFAQAGFLWLGEYDWRKTEHFYIDDYSQAYIPHQDKTSGKLMSLNMEFIKKEDV